MKSNVRIAINETDKTDGYRYYNLIYEEDGERRMGYGSYKKEIISHFLEKYFGIPKSEQADVPVVRVKATWTESVGVTWKEYDYE